MASDCSPAKPAADHSAKPSFYSVLEKLPLDHLRSSERFFLWLEFVFSVMSGTPLDSSAAEKMGRGRSSYETVQRGFLDCIALLGDEMERRPYEDLLGGYHEMLNSRIDRTVNGQFYTPTNICRMMARITVSEQFAENLKPGGSHIAKRTFLRLRAECACRGGSPWPPPLQNESNLHRY